MLAAGNASRRDQITSPPGSLDAGPVHGCGRFAGRGWYRTDREVDLIVADYFDMLRLGPAGETYVKKHRNEALQKLTGWATIRGGREGEGLP
jgi:hypothetical protein